MLQKLGNIARRLKGLTPKTGGRHQVGGQSKKLFVLIASIYSALLTYMFYVVDFNTSVTEVFTLGVAYLLEATVVFFLFKMLGQLRLLAVAILSLVFVQIFSYIVSYQFIPKLGIENLDSLYILGNIDLTLIISVCCAFTAAAILIWRQLGLLDASRKAVGRFSLLSVSVLCLVVFEVVKPNGIQSEEKAFIEKNPPLADFVSLISSNFFTAVSSGDNIGSLPKYVSRIDFGRTYPLIKEKIYVSPPILKSWQGTNKKPNILVFFNEGISARTLNHNSKLFPGISPNISKFAKQQNSTTFSNYYSHTAATFSGLLGQLCSIFPEHLPNDAWRNQNNQSFFCLTDLLKSEGYKTEFLYPHLRKDDYVADMLEKLSFDDVLAAKDITSKYLPDFDGLYPNNALRNQPLFEALFSHLSINQGDQPTFTAVYTYETHAYFDTHVRGNKFGDGSNHALNTLHDLDKQFGKFWEKFTKSKMYDDTLVVFTADHSKFPEPAYVDAMLKADVTGYDWHFIDYIPFIIHMKNNPLPAVIDAMYASSLDLTPTISQLLGLQNVKNPFLGKSIFERQQHKKSIGYITDLYFVMGQNGVENVTESSVPQHESIRAYLNSVHDLIKQNRVWPSKE